MRRFRAAHAFDAARMAELTSRYNIGLVMIYKSWFPDIPSTWRQVAVLHAKSLTAADQEVAFFVTPDADMKRVNQALAEFQPTLPRGAAIGLLAESLLRPKLIILVAVAIIAAFTYRTVNSTVDVARAMADRRLEHIAPAEFLERFYSGKTIMASDVGAVAWLAPTTTVLDIFGLGSNEPVRRLLSPAGYHANDVSEWASRTGARIAILEVCSAIADLVPGQWPLVGTMHIPRNVVFRDRIVAFFAIAPGEEASLQRNLQSFAFPAGASLVINPPRSEMTRRCWE